MGISCSASKGNGKISMGQYVNMKNVDITSISDISG